MTLHNKNPVGQTIEGLPSRLVTGYCRVWNFWMKRVQGGAPPFALSGQLPSANKEKAFLYQHPSREPTTLPHAAMNMCCHWAACCCSPALLQPVDTYSLGKAGSDSDFSVL